MTKYYKNKETIISLIYDTALQPSLWSNVIKSIAEYTQCPNAFMRITDCKTKKPIREVNFNWSESYHDNYKKYFYKKDFFMQELYKRPYGKMYNSNEFKTGKIKNSELYNDLIKTESPGLINFFGGNLFEIDGKIIRLSFQRPENYGFNSQDDAFLNSLVEHFKRSYILSTKANQLKKSNAIQEAIIQNTNLGVIFYSWSGHFLGNNKALEQTLKKDLYLYLTQSRLRSRNHQEDLILEKIYSTGFKEGLPPDTFYLFRESSEDYYYELSVLQVKEKDEYITNLTVNPGIIFIIKQIKNSREISIEEVFKKINLSKSEIKLAHQLLNGNNLKEAAQIIHISYNTAKTQLKSIFCKTNTRHQGELITFLEKQKYKISAF